MILKLIQEYNDNHEMLKTKSNSNHLCNIQDIDLTFKTSKIQT